MFLVNYRCKKNKTKRIPDVAIHTYFKKYEKPIKGEGFDKIVERSFVPEGDLTLFHNIFKTGRIHSSSYNIFSYNNKLKQIVQE